MADPRVFLASERTLLAWIRTGITVMGLGFVVAKFGFFLALVSFSAAGPSAAGTAAMFPRPHGISSVIGIALVILGAGAILGAARNHQSFVRSIPAVDRPSAAVPGLALLVAVAIAVTGLLLAAYLAVS